MRARRILRAFVSAMLFAVLQSVTALDLNLGLMFTVQSDAAKPTTSSEPLRGCFNGGLYQKAGDFEFLWSVIVNNEKKYPAEALSGLSGSLSYYTENAGVKYQKDGIRLTLGQFANHDMVNSPYSLFISGVGHQAIMAEVQVERGDFFYLDRWVGLNHNLQQNLYFTGSSIDPSTSQYAGTATVGNLYRDRGVALKSYGVQKGPLRIGFQDALLYTGEYFNIDTFVNPAPGWLVQYGANAVGRPWANTMDMNNMIGFFADYATPKYYAYAQVLIDDLVASKIVHPERLYYAPNKLAGSLGGTINTQAGTFGLYLAGATRFTFESVRNEFYSYTYYPGSAIVYGGELIGIPMEDLMIGYVNGENNFASMVTWKKALPGAEVSGSLEFKLTGEQSPANPFHDQVGVGPYDWFRWLDDPVLEKKLTLTTQASHDFGRIKVWFNGVAGYVWNRLELVRVTAADSDVDTTTGEPLREADGSEPLWRPSDESCFFGALTVGLTYRLGL